MNKKYQPLFEPYQLTSNMELKNRLVMAPMTHWSSNDDGTVSDEEIKYYVRRANGVGMVITACIYVSPSGKGFHGEFSGTSDDMIPGLRKLATAIKEQGAKAILQMFHGGRMCPPHLVPNGDVVSASAIPAERPDAATPRELNDGEIRYIIKDFGETTRRAIEAGFDGVEIHGANYYLIHQFFSPHSNRRDDEWGGTVEKRMAFSLAIIDEVKNVIATHAKEPFILGYRLSPEEPENPGITMDDTLKLVDVLADKDLDYLHVSLMDFWSTARSGVDKERPRIDLIKEKTGDRVPVMGVGSIQTADDALKALQSGVPLLALGREIIIDPDWVTKVKEGKESEIETELDKEAQDRLVVPDPLWNVILNRPGWFPGV